MKNIDLIIKKIKNEAIAKLIFSLIALAVLLLYTFKAYMEEFLSTFSAIVVAVLFVLFIVLCIDGALDSKKPLRKFPHLPEMAKIIDYAEKPDYENRYIYIFGNVFVNKTRITDMSYLEDIYVIYREKVSSKEIQNIRILTKNSDIKINTAGINENEKEKLIQTIKSFCPNAVIGRTRQNMKYYREKKRIN